MTRDSDPGSIHHVRRLGLEIESPCAMTLIRDRVTMYDDSDSGSRHHVRCLGSKIESDLSHIFSESLLKQSTDHDAGYLKGTCAGQKPNTFCLIPLVGTKLRVEKTSFDDISALY